VVDRPASGTSASAQAAPTAHVFVSKDFVVTGAAGESTNQP
jgi:hypothetical protein